MNMKTDALVSEEEYLNTTYEPDCEFEDGVLIERNVGKKRHGRLQALITTYFDRREKLWGIEVLGDVRHRIREGRYMLPDVCIFRVPSPNEQVFTSPPLVWIEILSSPEDRPIRVNEKIRQLLKFGVPNVWAIDSETLEAEIDTPQGRRYANDGVLRVDGTPIELRIDDLDQE